LGGGELGQGGVKLQAYIMSIHHLLLAQLTVVAACTTIAATVVC
jgi:hypothetical protein